VIDFKVLFFFIFFYSCIVVSYYEMRLCAVCPISVQCAGVHRVDSEVYGVNYDTP